jgi:hypothetical protein
MHTTSIPALPTKFEALFPVMDERIRRQWAATEALALGYGGISAVATATGLARNTIAVGIGELRQRTEAHEPTPTIRRPGAGRKRLAISDPGLLQLLDALVDPATRGDPDCPLRWTCKSTGKLADEWTRQGHPVSDRTVARLLHEAGYSRQANRKTGEGGCHPDRNAQFEYINDQVRQRQHRGQPVISVDTKKVAEDGGATLSQCPGGDDYSGRRRQQRGTLAVVEDGVAGVGGRVGVAVAGVPLPAGNEQVEQDRTSAVLLHHAELAGPTAGES